MTAAAVMAAVASATAATRTAGITVDSRTQFQHVSGFGGFSPSPQWSYWLTDTDMDKLFGKGDNQLGLNILRLYIANNKSYWNAGVANAKRAKKYGAFVFASPWSPPASWKSNNSDSNGGELLTSHYQDWAVFLNDYYKYMKQQGVTIDAVSVQNEPDWNASYQSCIWTGQQMANFLGDYGHLIECKVIAPEAIHFTRSMHEPILNSDRACEQLDILGGHFYGWDGSSYPLAAQKGKEVWMTEFLINERQEQQKLNINWKDDGFLFARSLNDAMLANMSAWVHYSLKRYYGALGDGTYGTSNNQITKRGYILSHFAKYVSGTTRVRHALDDASGKLYSSAYLSQTGDSVVVMVMNPSDDTFATTVKLPFMTLGGQQISTTESTNVRKTDLAFDTETQQPQVEVEPWSVNTFIFVKSSDGEGGSESQEQMGEVVFEDNFAMAGASCIPDGWKAKFEDGTRTAGNYQLGPRLMSFSPEGLMTYGFYFRTNTAASGYVSYGEETKFRLTLEPGTYTLSFSTLGWKATPTIKASVLKSTGSQVKTVNATPDCTVSGAGSNVRVTRTTDKEMTFDVTTTTKYLLKWEVAAASGGLNEAVVGNIRLVKHADETAIEQVNDRDTEASTTIFDLSGRRIDNPRQQGLVVKDGSVRFVRQ